MLNDINPKVSVIIPVHNRAFCINNSIESVINQSYDNIEIILVDDGSTDDTYKIMTNFASVNSNIICLKQNNSGACTARNNGFSVAKGDYVIFLDSDDMLEQNHIESYVKIMLLNEGCNVYGPWSEYTYNNGSYDYNYTGFNCNSKDLLEEWLKGWWIVSCCIMWPKTLLSTLGGWDESLAADQDGDLSMRALIEGTKYVYCRSAPPAKIIHYVGEDNISRIKSLNKLKSRQAVMMKIEELMINKGIFIRKYRKALAVRYYNYAYYNLNDYPEIADELFSKYRKLNNWGRPPGSLLNWLVTLLFGLRQKEKLSDYIAKFTRR